MRTFFVFYVAMGTLFHSMVEWEWVPKHGYEWMKPLGTLIGIVFWPIILFLGKDR